MTTLSKTVDATPEQVWEILADGWLYPLWVVGASRMRDVDDNWPEVGAQLHHSVGTWPVLLDDTTEVTECRPMRGLKLRARAWPTGLVVKNGSKIWFKCSGAMPVRVSRTLMQTAGKVGTVPWR